MKTELYWKRMKQNTFPMGEKDLPVSFKPVVMHASQHLMRNGIRNFNLEKICHDLHISKKTVYKFFSTKENLIEALLLHNFQSMFTEVKAITDDSAYPLRKIFVTIETIIRHVGVNAPDFIYDVKLFFPHIWDEIQQFREEVIVSLRESCIHAQQLGLIRSGVDIDFFLTMIMKIAQDVFQPEFLIHQPDNIGTILRKFIDLIMNGLMEKDKRLDPVTFNVNQTI